MMWAGDQNVDWSEDDGLPSVITAALSLGLSGHGLSHSDLGGYTTLYGMRRTKELLLRWIELAAFSPLMRSHEGNGRATTGSSTPTEKPSRPSPRKIGLAPRRPEAVPQGGRGRERGDRHPCHAAPLSRQRGRRGRMVDQGPVLPRPGSPRGAGHVRASYGPAAPPHARRLGPLLERRAPLVALSEFRYGGLAAGGPMFMFLPPLRRERGFVDSGKIHLRGGRHDDRDGPHPGRCRGAGLLLRRARLPRSLSRGPRPAEPRGGGVAVRGSGSRKAGAVLTRSSYASRPGSQDRPRLFSPRSFLFVAASAEVAEALSARVRDLVAREISGFGRILPEFHARAYDPVLAQRGAAALVLDAFLG